MRYQVVGVLLLAALISLACDASAANYMYEKSSMKGVGYENTEKIISTQTRFNGTKLVEKISGSGNVITDKSELEAERQIGSNCGGNNLIELIYWRGVPEPNGNGGNAGGPNDLGPMGNWNYWDFADPNDHLKFRYRGWGTGFGPMDYINFTSEREVEYMPVSYQTGTYDQKWFDKLCVQNYEIGAVLTEMYTHAEHLQKTSEIKTRAYKDGLKVGIKLTADNHQFNANYPPASCCTGVLEANINSNVIGVAHIGWISRNPQADAQLKGRHAEYGRSVEDLTGVFSIEKFIQLWGNSTCGAISVDWLPCA
jgi:hypothetical protein